MERVRDAAETALDFFARPSFSGSRFDGFRTDLCDGGADPRLDLYIEHLGERDTLGRAVPPTRAEGGAFVQLSPELQNRPRGSPRLFRGDGIRFTVAHEVFHLVQFAYVPARMPGWIDEGTANTLAFLFDGVDHPVLLSQADFWLREPWRPLWFPAFNCDRCYGGVWWWATYRDLLRAYFERLGEHYRRPGGVGLGLAALEEVFQERNPEYSLFDAPALHLDFAVSFAVALPQVAYPRTLRPPPVRYRIQARPRRHVRRVLLSPMSVHYVALRAPAGAAGMEVVTRGVEGPDPLQTLLVGYTRTPRQRVRVARAVNPCVVTFPPTYGAFTSRIGVNFRRRSERSSLLVVANRSSTPVRYEISVASTARRVRAPSPAEGDPPLCTKQAVAGSTADVVGDAVAAPDIERLDVAATTVPEVPGRLVTFAVRFANRSELVSDDLVSVMLDTDRDRGTGCGPTGAELALVVLGLPGADAARLARCRNGELDVDGPQGTFRARFDGVRRTLVLVTSAADLGSPSAFTFRVDASARDAAGVRQLDSLPDGAAVFCFPRCASTLSAMRTAPRLERLASP